MARGPGLERPSSPSSSREAGLPRDPTRLWQRDSGQGGPELSPVANIKVLGRDGKWVLPCALALTSLACLDCWIEENSKADPKELGKPGNSSC